MLQSEDVEISEMQLNWGATRRLKDLKVGVRLGLGFGAVLALLIVITLIGNHRLVTLNAGTDLIVHGRYETVKVANQI